MTSLDLNHPKSFILGEHGITPGPDYLIQLYNISPFNNYSYGASNKYLALATDITPVFY